LSRPARPSFPARRTLRPLRVSLIPLRPPPFHSPRAPKRALHCSRFSRSGNLPLELRTLPVLPRTSPPISPRISNHSRSNSPRTSPVWLQLHRCRSFSRLLFRPRLSRPARPPFPARRTLRPRRASLVSTRPPPFHSPQPVKPVTHCPRFSRSGNLPLRRRTSPVLPRLSPRLSPRISNHSRSNSPRTSPV
jgi:hypothetical protein